MTFLCYKQKSRVGVQKEDPVFQDSTELKYKEGREVDETVETPSAQSCTCREGDDAQAWRTEATVYCETGGWPGVHLRRVAIHIRVSKDGRTHIGTAIHLPLKR